MQHAINLIGHELEIQTEAETRKVKSLADTKRRYDEMCAKHARELKPIADMLNRETIELKRIQIIKADYQSAKNLLEGKSE